MRAPKHPGEKDRLVALRYYDILDTPQERDFDDIVALAAAICQTEAATITFIDADRQWFKAAVGMPSDTAPLELAVCAHAVLADGFLEIADTRADPRTSDNPFCGDPVNLRFYAGAPLVSANGYPIGTLCVLGMTPKHLTPTQRQALQVLARQVMTLLDLRMAVRTGDILRKEIDHRVKNSLQLVGSLLSMQRRASDSPDVRDALAQARERVLALASLHDTMQRADQARSVNLRRLIGDMCALIMQSMTDRITLTAEIGDIEISAKVASSIAVIVNEFAGNALKHAFGPEETGTIHFVSAAMAQGRLALTCSDTGRGFSGDAGVGGGLGLLAMQACAEQINGTLVFDTPEKGCRMVLLFDPAGA